MNEQKLNILILEDNPDDAELIVRELEKAGFVFELKRVETEKDFKKALAEKPDIILADYNLPSFDGMVAIKLQQQIAPEIPLIIVSGTIGEELIVECLKAGATGYIFKDRLSRLPLVVKRALKEYNERRELKQMQQDLHKSEEKYRNLVEKMEEGIVSVDENEKFTFLNNAACNIFGYSKEELFKMTLKDFTTPDEYKKIIEQTSIRKKGRTSKYEVNIIKKDGNNAIISVTSSPLFDENRRYIGDYGIINDITERKKVEEDIRRSAAYTRSLIEASIDPLVTIGPDGKITDVNEATEKVTGRTRKELIGSDFADYFTEPVKAKESYKQVLNKGFVRDYPLEIKHKNGNITPVLYNASLFKDESGKIVGVFAAARDITEIKQSHAHIAHLNSVLRAIRNINQLIVKEKDRDCLLRKACDILVDARGYDAVWFGLMEDDNIINKIVSSGFGKDAFFFYEQVRGIDQPFCIRNAMARKETVALVDKSVECGDCSLKDSHADKEAAIIRVEHGGKLFGLLAVSFSPDVVVDEDEKGLLKEAVSDIAFALHDMKQEEDRKKSEIEAHLLHKLIKAINEAPDLETAINTTLNLTCEYTEWVMGEAWIPNHDETALEYYLGCCNDSSKHNKRMSHFIKLSKQFAFPQGVGLPGRIWQSKQPEWRHDISDLSEEIYLRAKPSKEAGLKAALGVPIISNGQVLTVIVFYMTTLQPENERLVKIISTIATQLGTVIMHKKAEEALLKSEEKYRQLAETAKDVIMVLDLKGNVKYINQEGIDLCGYSKEEILKMDINKVLPADKIPISDNNFAKRIAGDKSLFMYEIDFFNKKGDKIPVEIKSSLIAEQGKPSGVLITARDITERKNAEDNLKLALVKATESDRLKTAFLNTMSHELRTPLNAVIGFSDLINYETENEIILDFAKGINKSGNHLLGIVEDIFDVTMIESGEIKIQKEEYEITKIMEDISKMIKAEQEKTDKQNIELRYYPVEKDKNLLVFTDAGKLKKILINLLKNALKFTDEGFIEWGYKTDIQRKQPMLKFYIKDTGIGISKEKQEIIFDVFRQADDTFTRKHEGTGIGLSVSKKLIELLGGEIWIDSEEEKGSTFYFILPYLKPEVFQKTESLKPEIKKELKFPGKTVLIVEDVESNYFLLDVILKRLEIKTLWAKDGNEAIQLCLSNNDIDLVLMDIKMPDMNGYEATKQIKKTHPELPIIAVTAFALYGDDDKASEAGCDDYITKPIKRRIFLEKIERYLK